MQNERESLECDGRLTAFIPEACRVLYLLVVKLCAPVIEVLRTRNWRLKMYALPTTGPRAKGGSTASPKLISIARTVTELDFRA